MRLFLESCSLLRLMYSQIFLVTWVRGRGLLPITSPRAALGVIGFMNAALGFLFFVAIVSLLSIRVRCNVPLGTETVSARLRQSEQKVNPISGRRRSFPRVSGQRGLLHEKAAWHLSSMPLTSCHPASRPS